MGAADQSASPEDAAAAYAAALRAVAAPEGYGEPIPRFDVLMLGIGPEGHVASIFPEAPAAYDERAVVAVHGCPKPPPTRVTLTFAALTAAKEVWVLASGPAKAPAVALTLSGAGQVQVPAAGARGRSRTLLLLDEAAATGLPRDLRRRASPGA
jgi:6-phosphogluconolactonase